MKVNRLTLGKALFSVVSVGSLVALSAYSQASLDRTSAASAGQMRTASNSLVAQTGSNTSSPAAPTTTTTETRNLSQLAQDAASSGSFTTLLKAVQAAGLTKNLTGKRPYTVFAPTDAAFDALPSGTLQNLLQPANKRKLVKLLAYHVVPGRITSSQLKSGKVKTVEGMPVTVFVDSVSNTVTVNGAKVIQADIPASNGVVHAIDQVLIPPGFK